MPQVWYQPALTAVNVPVCAAVRLCPLLPQQVTEPVLLNAQVCESPALIAVYVPVGTSVSWRWLSRPQHAIVPVLRSAQVCVPPALTAV